MLRNRLTALALAAAALVTTSPVLAAPVSADATGKALLLVPLQITKVDDLDFGTIISPASSGTVSLDAATGARTFSTGVIGDTSAPGHHGYFAGAGSPNQQVILSLYPPAQLTDSNGDTIDVTALTLDNKGNPIRTIDPTSRTFYVGVGGVLSLAADQPEGDYSGVFQLYANYQ